ncbi:hypothetical protein GNT69_21485 [Bacillus sp. B15-48]|nr:hypothetical protein [Bacillus sp. B15-48]
MEFTQCGKGIDLITLSMIENLEFYGGISYLSELQAHADVEKFNEIEDLILEAWKEREKNNILFLAAKNDWEIEKVIAELDKINEIKIDDHKSITDALAEMYEAPWQEKELFTSATINGRMSWCI